MSFSRFSVLAVFLMMVLSAFVAVPNQYVGAEHEEGTEHGAYFVYIMTADRADAIVEATPFSLHFGAPPMSDNSPYELELICEGAEDGILGIYGTWVTSEGGNAGDFNNITSWSVKNTNNIQLEKFVYDPMYDIIDFEHPMVVFEDNESSGGGHIPAEVFDQEEFYCDGEDDFFDPVSQDIVVDMISLSEWEISVDAAFSEEASNQLRSDIAQTCAAALGTDEGSVTSECFDYFFELMDGEHGDHHMSGCSPEWGLNDTECETFMEECNDGGANMTCLYILYELCVATDDGGDMCDSFGEDGEEDGPDMFSFLMSVIGYDSGYEDSSNVVNAVDELMEGFTLHHDIEDIAHYDVYHFNVTEEEVANYTVDINGVYNESTDEWFEPSYVYLYEGTHDIPSDADEFEGNQRICEYSDGTEMYVDCYHLLSTHLEVGSYSMFITNSCNHVWTYNESSERHEFDGYDCHYGSYNLSVHNDDNDTHVDNIVGDISNLDPTFVLGESHEIHREVAEEFAFFPFYETHTYTVTGDDNVSYFYSDQDADHNQTLIVWLYAGSFTETDWSENLMYVSSGYEDNGTGDYNFSFFDLSELNAYPGDYVFVTTGEHTHMGGNYDAVIVDGDDTILDSWSGELCGDYHYNCDDTTEADDRAYFTFAYRSYFQENDDGGDNDDLWSMFFMSLAENMSAYDDGDISEEEFADRVVDLLHEMAEMGVFEGDGGAPSPEEALEATDANGDGYMSFEEFQDHWESQNDTADLDWSDVQVLFSDADTNDDDLLEIDELQYFIDGIEDMTSDHDGGGPDVGDCPFDNIEFCHEIGNFCEGDMEHWPDHCLIEFGEELAHYCLENNDSGCEAVVEICDDASGVNETVCEGYNDFNHDDYHGGGDYPLLDFISGYADPHDWEDFMNITEENVVGNLSDNEDSHAIVSGSFLLVFDDVDDTLDTHFFSLEDDSDMSFWCSDEVGGEANTEIPFSQVNDGTENCGDGADEQQYDESGDRINWFDCHDGSEVWIEEVNNGVNDCSDGEDEGHHGDDYDAEVSFTFNLLDDYKIINCMHCVEGVFSDDNTSVTFDVEYNTFEIEFAHISYEEKDDCPVDDEAWCESSEEICDDEHEDTNATACAELVIVYCETEGNEGHELCAEADSLCENGTYPEGDDRIWGDWEDTFCATYNYVEEPDEVSETDPAPEPPACDHVVAVVPVGTSYGFNPVDLTIKVGDTVCWQWTNTTEPHNVVEIEVAYTSDLVLTDVMKGFTSGEANTSGDFRHTFATDDMTHYYVCEAHAATGMVGKITVGEGSEEKEEVVETAIEDSGLPSVSFIVGVLVLVGAAGLRRRIQ